MKVSHTLLFVFLFCIIFHPENTVAQNIKGLKSPVYVLPENVMKNIPDASVKSDLSNGWKPISSSHGVSNFQKKFPETSTKAYKGVCIIESPIKTVYKIISDVGSHREWVRFCKSSVLVANPSPIDSVQYYSFDIPWPFSDRDIVVHTNTEADWENGKVIITSIAAAWSKIPLKKGCVRLTDSSQQWTLEKISPVSTRVTFKSYTPLQGSVPRLIRNIISNLIPSSTLKKLKQISTKQFLASREQFLADSEFDGRESKLHSREDSLN